MPASPGDYTWSATKAGRRETKAQADGLAHRIRGEGRFQLAKLRDYVIVEAEVGIGQREITFPPRPEHLDLQANQASTLVPQ
jgi:hypothetical protein